ncbi:MAG: hypothetical protein RBR08_08730 [Desulforegulaceae bacterium]|nr:hypothetical protein [Desulforegulaceae bacterium]
MDINEKIIKELDKGFIIEKNFFEFAKNIGIDLNFYDIKKIFSDSDNDFFYELGFFIFTPDFEMRKRFSLIWLEIQQENKTFDLDLIFKKTCRQKICYKELIDYLSIDKKMFLFFFEKLNLFEKTDEKILNTINKFNDLEKQEISSVIWKNAKNIKDEKINILNDYLEKSMLPFLFSNKEFNFFINILSGWKVKDFNFVFYLKKLFSIYHKALRQALETKDFLKTNNIETYMVQGGRVSFANIDEIYEKKNLIWQIALRLQIQNEVFIEDGFDMVFNANK